ncbi:MAG: S26 family signal peptidase [Bacteroidia bacterium]
MGLTGESIKMRNGVIYINSQAYLDPIDVNRPYALHLGLRDSTFFAGTNFEQSGSPPKSFFVLDLRTTELALVDDKWMNVNEISRMENIHSAGDVIGGTVENNWNRYNWGPFKIPNVGDKVVLNDKNERLYESLFFEKRKKNLVTTECYFLISDDRGTLYDSRFIGLIPKRAIIGKVMT